MSLVQIAFNEGYVTAAWTLGQDDTGDAVNFSQYPDKTVQVSGDFGSGGTVTVEGSMDGTNWAPLTGDGGTALVFSTDGIAVIRENPRSLRVVASDTASLAVTATIGAAALR